MLRVLVYSLLAAVVVLTSVRVALSQSITVDTEDGSSAKYSESELRQLLEMAQAALDRADNIDEYLDEYERGNIRKEMLARWIREMHEERRRLAITVDEQLARIAEAERAAWSMFDTVTGGLGGTMLGGWLGMVAGRRKERNGRIFGGTVPMGERTNDGNASGIRRAV